MLLVRLLFEFSIHIRFNLPPVQQYKCYSVAAAVCFAARGN